MGGKRRGREEMQFPSLLRKVGTVLVVAEEGGGGGRRGFPASGFWGERKESRFCFFGTERGGGGGIKRFPAFFSLLCGHLFWATQSAERIE